MNYKFSEGDRIRVTKIDDMDYYGLATYKIGDVGTISIRRNNENGIVYGIDFDDLPASGEDGCSSSLNDFIWYNKEDLTADDLSAFDLVPNVVWRKMSAKTEKVVDLIMNLHEGNK